MELRWVLSLLELSTIVSLSCRSVSWRSENRVLGQLGWMFGGLGALIVGAEHRRLDDLPTVSSCSCAASVSQSEVSSTSSCFIWSKVRLHLSVCCWPPVDPTTTFTWPHSLVFVCMCISIVGACCSPAHVRHMSRGER